MTYPSLSGTNTVRDWVEFLSQVNENFLRTPEVLSLLKNKEGKSLPPDLIAKIEATRTFNQGFLTTEFLASALVDMKLHLVAVGDEMDPVKFERDALKELGMPSEVVMRHRLAQFGHLFSGDSYAAGYYGYLWSQGLAYDADEAFEEAGNPYDPVVAKKLNDDVFSVGNSLVPDEAYRKFRGRDPDVKALLRARGFPVESEKTR